MLTNADEPSSGVTSEQDDERTSSVKTGQSQHFPNGTDLSDAAMLGGTFSRISYFQLNNLYNVNVCAIQMSCKCFCRLGQNEKDLDLLYKF